MRGNLDWFVDTCVGGDCPYGKFGLIKEDNK